MRISVNDRKVQRTRSVLETVAYRTAATFPILRSISLLSTYDVTSITFPHKHFSFHPQTHTLCHCLLTLSRYLKKATTNKNQDDMYESPASVYLLASPLYFRFQCQRSVSGTNEGKFLKDRRRINNIHQHTGRSSGKSNC